MCDMPQSGVLANNQLKYQEVKYSYCEVPYTPGLCKHYIHNANCSLVVDKFGTKYQGKDNVNHTRQSLQKFYQVKVN